MDAGRQPYFHRVFLAASSLFDNIFLMLAVIWDGQASKHFFLKAERDEKMANKLRYGWIGFIVFLIFFTGPLLHVRAEAESAAAAEEVSEDGEGFAVHFEDPALEQAIREALKLPEGPIGYEKLMKLTSLYPQGETKIKSLKGLEWATGLRQLYLPNNEITDLTPLQSLYGLNFVALNDNRITNACPLAALTRIEKLVISNNQIEDIGCFSRLTSLTDLLASNNRISDVSPLASLKKLKWIDLGGNPLNDMTPLRDIDALEHLYVDTAPLNEASAQLLHQLEQSGVGVNRPETGIRIVLDGKLLLVNEAPMVAEGTTLVPFRPLFEQLGFVIEWNEATHTVTGKREGLTLSLTPGSGVAKVNGETRTLPTAPQLVNSSLVVPARFVSEAVQYDVSWDERNRTVRIAKPYRLDSPNGRSSVQVGGNWVQQQGQSNWTIIQSEGGRFMLTDEPKPEAKQASQLKDWVQRTKKNLEAEGGKLEATESFQTAQGLQGYRLQYASAEDDSHLTFILSLIEGEYGYYRLAAYTDSSRFQEMKPVFEQMIGSFTEQKPAAALFKEKFGKLTERERLLDAADYYRRFGFFEADKGLTDEAFRQRFVQWYKPASGEEPGIFAPDSNYGEYADLYLLAEDTSRVWLADPEADVGNGNEVYVKTLKAWSAISRGAFIPTDIEEHWASDEGPVTVTFTLNGQKKTLYPLYYNDFIDASIVNDLNGMIRSTGYQFAKVELGEVFVTVLTAEEKLRLERERLLPFDKE